MEVYKFKCYLSSQIWPNNDEESPSSWYLCSVITNRELPFSEKCAATWEDLGKDAPHSYLVFLSGNMPKMISGVEYSVEAVIESKKNGKYGYKVKRISYEMPESLEGQHKFLKTIVTKKQCENILKVYPDFISKVINDEEISTKEIFNVGPFIMNRITTKIKAINALSKLHKIMEPFNIPKRALTELMENEKNPVKLIAMIKQNPYILTKIRGLSFMAVDKTIESVFPDAKVSMGRVISFVKDFLAKIAYQDGHTLVKIDSIINGIETDKGIEYKGIMQIMPECISWFEEFIEQERSQTIFSNNVLYFHEEYVGLYYHYQIESYILSKVRKLLQATPIVTRHIKESIKATEKLLGFPFTDEQLDAINGVSLDNVMAITGPAGTGKSQTLRAITDMYKQYSIALCSLSAMAAKKMNEFTGQDSFTIHKLLGYNGKKFTYNENNKLPYRIIAVDEMSMPNTWIFQHLLKAIEPGTKLILIGDISQLPSIGAGCVFADLIRSGLIPVYTLTEIHRQAKLSGIVMDANKIKDGINPFNVDPVNNKWIVSGELKDMYYYFTNNKNDAQNVMAAMFVRAVRDKSLNNVVAIVPRKKNVPLSTTELNNIYQQRFAVKGDKQISFKGYKFVSNDKIVQRENDYKNKNVINGEIGYVVEIDNEENCINVRFGESKIVRYSIYDFDEISLAYCLTTHLFQGNQADIAIVGLDWTHDKLLSNELLYTAITRAAKTCLFIGNYSAFKKAIGTRLNKRKTILSTLIN